MKAVLGFGEVKELLKTDKGVRVILAAGAVLILLIAFGGIFTGSGSSGRSSKAAVSVSDIGKCERELEQRLADILGEIEGVGNVRVMVTLDTSEQTEYGKNADMLISVTAPAVRGVIVVCDGGDSITVKEKVVNAVSGVFGINTLHISVTR
ncbi:MAG: hypothetical protein IJT87_06990 [Ruminiclostridium sp.]|nr:hypothetical protein [Ruminiclostridium sp.]